jgi:hypothetical protein
MLLKTQTRRIDKHEESDLHKLEILERSTCPDGG